MVLYLQIKEIPKELKNFKDRKCNTSIFCYDNELTLLSYKPKPNKVIYLLSSCDEEGAVNQTTNKPYMVEFYNKTKGGVDTFDQMCSVMSCSRKTNRWPMCQFYGILNMAFINSYVIYTHNMYQQNKIPLNRPKFMKQLHFSLIKSKLAERQEITTLKTTLRANIKNILQQDKENSSSAPQNPKNKKSKICAFSNVE